VIAAIRTEVGITDGTFSAGSEPAGWGGVDTAQA
jgi:hypothetical protein